MKQKRVCKPALLRSATPYPWRRNYKGDLCGADGRPIYFQGADAVLVEHSPEMVEALLIIRALTEGRRDPPRTLSRIAAVTARILARIEKRTDDSAWCKGSIS
jgi:hypothetical protein